MSNQNYTAAHSGKFADIPNGKLFLKDLLNLTGMEISLNSLPAGGGVPFYHKHKENEEVYIFLKGKGQFQVDGEIFEVTEGSSVRISPAGSRTLRNVGSEDLQFVVIQSKENSLTQWVATDGVILEDPVKW